MSFRTIIDAILDLFGGGFISILMKIFGQDTLF